MVSGVGQQCLVTWIRESTENCCKLSYSTDRLWRLPWAHAGGVMQLGHPWGLVLGEILLQEAQDLLQQLGAKRESMLHDPGQLHRFVAVS